MALIILMFQINQQSKNLQQQVVSIKQQNDFKAVDLIHQYTEALYSSGLDQFFQDLNYNRGWLPDCEAFDQTENAGRTIEVQKIREDDLKLAKLLDLLNSVCFALQKKLITVNAVSSTVLGYVIANCWAHPGVQKYLDWVDQDHPVLGHQQKQAFRYFRKYAKEEIIPTLYPSSGQNMIPDNNEGVVSLPVRSLADLQDSNDGRQRIKE